MGKHLCYLLWSNLYILVVVQNCQTVELSVPHHASQWWLHQTQLTKGLPTLTTGDGKCCHDNEQIANVGVGILVSIVQGFLRVVG